MITLPSVEEGSATKDVESHEYQGNLLFVKETIEVAQLSSLPSFFK